MNAHRLAHSPIAHAEYLHQQRSLGVRRARRWLRPFIWLLRLLAVFTAVGVIALEVTGLLVGWDSSRLEAVSEPLALTLTYLLPIGVLLPFTLLLHLHVLLRVQIAASDSVSREKRTGTWDTLLLTAVDGNRIVYGKWWATLRGALPSLPLLLLLRTGVVVWGALLSHRVSFYQLYNSAPGQFEWVFEFDPHYAPQYVSRILIAVLLLGVFTLATLAFAAAGGVVASLLSKRSSAGLAGAIFGRALFLVGLAVLLFYGSLVVMQPLYAIPYNSSDEYYQRIYGSAAYNVAMSITYGATGLVDNGTLLGMLLVRNDYQPDESRDSSYSRYMQFEFNRRLAGAALLVGIYGVMIWLMLRFGRWLATRQGALKPAPASRKPTTLL
jgi:hypothetical protein